MENKFLADGRKVAVVGQLNQQEWIVQEVFVTDSGDEIPAGERFTTKSLLDEPAKSYKQKELEKLEAAIADRKRDLERYKKEAMIQHCDLQATKAINKCIRNATGGSMEEGALGNLVDFLTGNIEWIVENNGYSHSDPVPFREGITNNDRAWGGEKQFDSLKLISLFGGSEGDLTYRIHRYSDGSGGGAEIMGFRSLDEAARKSIELTMKHLESDKPRTDLAVKLLLSKVSPYLTESEISVAKALVQKSLESANEGYDKQLADIEKSRADKIKSLTELLKA